MSVSCGVEVTAGRVGGGGGGSEVGVESWGWAWWWFMVGR
jgi:hypothetical protein